MVKKLLVATALLSAASVCSANVITFGEHALPNLSHPTTEWASQGITLADVYYYLDSRDTFDGVGISVLNSPGKVLFTAPVSNLSIDFWVISGTGTYSIFDAAHNLLESFSATVTSVEVLGSHTFASSSIASLEFKPDFGRDQVSTLRFDAATRAVPEPATLGLLGLGLIGLAVARKRCAAKI